jgi:hypothetical protein
MKPVKQSEDTSKKKDSIMSNKHQCALAEGFSLWEKLWAQLSFFGIGIIGTIAITQYNWKWVAVQHKALVSRIRGHFGYFGVNENHKSLKSLVYWSKRAWHKWLNRRSQRARLNWERFLDLSKDYPFPNPKVYVNIWDPHETYQRRSRMVESSTYGSGEGSG